MLTLEGRIAGPWAVELERVWVEQAPQLTQSKLVIDISNVIYADADGTRVLKAIYSQASPELVANTPWTQYLAGQITANPNDRSHEEQGHADND